mgnify:CR=1 FL=1
MNKKQKIIVSVVGITIVLLALLGLTYAYFLTRIQGNTNEKSISVTTADLKLVYGDGNGLIEADSIMPGTTLTTKKFTVKNEGNAKVDNYVVYLEELVNELTRVDDLVYTLTCTSDRENKTCNGVNETTFPKLAGMIVTNSIEVGETQSYELTITYKEMNVDQSDDMNKKISARVQIYNLTDIVDITGTVTNASEGDYVELHSDPKKSQIVNNKYLIAAVEPGTHTLYVKDKQGTVKGSKEITIKKGNTASVSGTNITVTNDSQTVNVDIKAIASTLTIDIGETKDYMPFDEGTLASAIYTSAKTKVNGTEFLNTPKTLPAQATSSLIYLKGTDPTSFTSSRSNATNYYISYADDYTIDETTGKFTLVNPTVATSKYTTSMASSLVGKYAVWGTSTPTVTNTQNQYRIYKISTNVSDITSTIKYADIEADQKSTEKELSTTQDDYGTSYYYRGGVEDNYVNFAGMCWKIVRIQGDGSIKLILEDRSVECNSSNYTGNWSDGNKIAFGYDSNEKADFLNYSGGLADSLKSFQTTLSSKLTTGKTLNNYLKVDDWCYDYNVASTDSSGNQYYGAYKRIYIDENPSLKCTGTKLNKYRDNIDMYVGTLTADEVSFAGATTDLTNYTHYLMNSYAKSNNLYWWGLSLSYFNTIMDSAFLVNGDGTLGNTIVSTDCSFRPTVTLKSSTIIKTGNGTKSNPYTVD